MIENGYVGKFTDIVEDEKAWFFFSRFQKVDATEYGNVPFSVNKEDGHCEAFMMFAPQNILILKTAIPVNVPKKYKLT